MERRDAFAGGVGEALASAGPDAAIDYRAHSEGLARGARADRAADAGTWRIASGEGRGEEGATYGAV
jgi:hypothetical protein